ncbi:glutamyl-tRNA reductase [Spartinivicinus poritis]|uniref:Glutamyl-tRNA reductase n=1 Tax=Spartinivicinus poritis TaxID=2994640 RepID=A0ABT5UC16_9GAMM|nr:glutamyl-tRNA reductase [Spartinivicinus sp. A2-2]MDE1463047.1 glutamyl-tRNA reductase [Spartinivicinus sp. A2-2]
MVIDSFIMGFLALGINHQTASVALREKVAFAPEHLADALQSIQKLSSVNEVAILSTCNRTEIYCEVVPGQEQPLLAWWADYQQLAMTEVADSIYQYWDESAVQHMMRVASGLDSMVLGEPQILGQLKTAYVQAQAAGTVGFGLSRWFESTFATAKQVRTQTAIGESPVSVAYAAVALARQIFGDISQNHALLIGAGETIELVARHLSEVGIAGLTIANRTLANAELLSSQFDQATPASLSNLPDLLPNADIVIASTASQLPVLGKGAVERALKLRKHRPIFMVDIAVPRDIEPQVATLADIYLYTVDDLREVIEENLKSRQTAAVEAENLVLNGSAAFMNRMRELTAVEVLKQFRTKIELLSEDELAKARKKLANGADPEQVLARFAKAITNKLLHGPSVQIKQAGAAGQLDRIEWVKQLFEIDQLTDKKS